MKPKGDPNKVTLKVTLGTKEIKDLDNPEITTQALGDQEFNNSGGPFDTLLFCKLENVTIQAPTVLTLTAEKKEMDGLAQKDLVEDVWLLCRYSIKDNQR